MLPLLLLPTKLHEFVDDNVITDRLPRSPNVLKSKTRLSPGGTLLAFGKYSNTSGAVDRSRRNSLRELTTNAHKARRASSIIRSCTPTWGVQDYKGDLERKA